MNNTGKKNMGVLLNTGTPATGLSFGYKPKTKLEVKWKRLLRELIDRTLNRFDAERHGDHCLNSTISDLRRDQLVSISWNWEEVPCMEGARDGPSKAVLGQPGWGKYAPCTRPPGGSMSGAAFLRIKKLKGSGIIAVAGVIALWGAQ